VVGAEVHATAVDRIPAELWVQMLRPVEAEPVALTKLRRVSRALYEACRQDRLWRLLSPPRAQGSHLSLRRQGGPQATFVRGLCQGSDPKTVGSNPPWAGAP
jgi:hypothetical protein